MEFSSRGAIVVAVIVVAAAAFACSLTIESGEVHGLHREVEPAAAAATPTPTTEEAR